MLPANQAESLIPYASKADPEYLQPIPTTQQESGVLPLDSLPAQYWNWLWNTMTTQHNLSVSTATSILTELQNVLKLADIVPDEADEAQLAEAIKKLTLDVIGDFSQLEFEAEGIDTVVDALNALYDTIKNDIDKRLKTIEDVIPEAATPSNKLTDEAFVLRHVATNTANFRGEWPTWDDVPTDGDQYPIDYSGNHNPTENDYMVVRDMTGYGSGTESPEQEVTLMTDGQLFSPYTTYGGIDTPVGASQVKFYTSKNCTFKYFIDIMSSTSDLKDISGTQSSPALIDIDPSKTHQIVIMIDPDSLLSDTHVYFSTLAASSYKGAWQFKYTGNWTQEGRDGWEPEFSLGSLVDYDELDKHYAKGTSQTLDLPNATIDGSGNLNLAGNITTVGSITSTSSAGIHAKAATLIAPTEEEIALAVSGQATVNGRQIRICELDLENHALILW